MARQAGFQNLSLDLIFGLPDQSLEEWGNNLGEAASLEPEHFSLYSLSIEEGTLFEKRVREGLIPVPNPDVSAEMYECAIEFLADKGYVHYEISNWARRSEKGKILNSRHNQQYWLNQPYLGFGAGAHGFAGGIRTENVSSPTAYINSFGDTSMPKFPLSPAIANYNEIDIYTEMQETMMLGLRLLVTGVSRSRFQNRFEQEMEDVFEDEIERIISEGLAAWGGENGDVLLLTDWGRLLGNQAFVEFV
ncbi:coproporphyrinogen III oxidase family protein, partial [Chloroflexota bacterium]